MKIVGELLARDRIGNRRPIRLWHRSTRRRIHRHNLQYSHEMMSRMYSKHPSEMKIVRNLLARDRIGIHNRFELDSGVVSFDGSNHRYYPQ